MLFTGLLACFSPSVPADIRVLWVQNGGDLTHTAMDFRHAMFFFCNGMSDPWLSELLSRYLIVRHAAWVTRCVAEDFYMPVAPYTLDDGFDESRTLILDPSVLMSETERTQTQRLHAESLKRSHPIDLGDAPQSGAKRTKLPPPQGERLDDTGDDTLIEPDIFVKDKSTQFISLAFVAPKRRRKPSKLVKKFESCISFARQKALIEPPPQQNYGIPAPLTPHTVYWNEVFAPAYAHDGAAEMRLSLNDLLRAPPIKAAIFDVNQSYLGRRFINNNGGS